jgi:hypothetical protein
MAAPTRYTESNDLHNSAKFSDITLGFDHVDFQAHKVILMAASRVLYAAFNSKVSACIADLCDVGRITNVS